MCAICLCRGYCINVYVFKLSIKAERNIDSWPVASYQYHRLPRYRCYIKYRLCIIYLLLVCYFTFVEYKYLINHLKYEKIDFLQ